MRRYFFIFFFLTACIYARAQGKGPESFISLEPYDFHLQFLREDTALLVDVREFFEYKKSRIRGAVNIPSSGNLEFAADTLDKNLVLFLYCTTGFRSSRVCEKFSEQGFRKVYNLEGGIAAWRKDGNPVERHRIRR